VPPQGAAGEGEVWSERRGDSVVARGAGAEERERRRKARRSEREQTD
jgi:hypothetical protein